jgi:hypothetical protein
MVSTLAGLLVAFTTSMAAGDKISSVVVDVKTGQDDKECGVFSVRIKQGVDEFVHSEYGDGQDWNEGHHLQETKVTDKEVTGEKVECVCALEERPGQKNITWDAVIRIEVRTAEGKKAIFERNIRFDTDHYKPMHQVNLGQLDLK